LETRVSLDDYPLYTSWLSGMYHLASGTWQVARWWVIEYTMGCDGMVERMMFRWWLFLASGKLPGEWYRRLIIWVREGVFFGLC
jgi:hypothetical protein